MKRIARKYIYETLYIVQGFYSGQWEDETEEETREEGRARLAEYRANMPKYIYRMVRRTTKTLITAETEAARQAYFDAGEPF